MPPVLIVVLRMELMPLGNDIPLAGTLTVAGAGAVLVGAGAGALRSPGLEGLRNIPGSHEFQIERGCDLVLECTVPSASVPG